MSSIATERLIGEVAKRHDLLLSRDDPVLVTVTLNELILAEALAQLQASLDAASQDIAASAAKQIEASKIIAEQLITAAADYVANEIRAAVVDTRVGRSADRPAEKPASSRSLVYRLGGGGNRDCRCPAWREPWPSPDLCLWR